LLNSPRIGELDEAQENINANLIFIAVGITHHNGVIHSSQFNQLFTNFYKFFLHYRQKMEIVYSVAKIIVGILDCLLIKKMTIRST